MESNKNQPNTNSQGESKPSASLNAPAGSTTPLLNKNNSIHNFLGMGGQSPMTNNMFNFGGLSLVSPAYGQPVAKPKQEVQFTNPLDMKKSPSLIKMESKSDAGKQETPIGLPIETPAAPSSKEKTPNVGTSLMTPAMSSDASMKMPIKQDPLASASNKYMKELADSGMDVANLNTYNPSQTNVRKPQEEPTLQNIVSTVDLKCKLDLKTIALNARNTEYNPKRFAAAIMKIRNPKTTALIFSSGKMVCTGAKSEEDSKKAAKKYAKTIKNMGFDVRFTDFKVQNIVASADVGFAIRLESLSHRHAEFCQYEPEIFPGLIYRIYQPKVVVLIFVSGKIVLTGAKTREQIKEAYTNILPALQMHKKEESTVSARSGSTM